MRIQPVTSTPIFTDDGAELTNLTQNDFMDLQQLAQPASAVSDINDHYPDDMLTYGGDNADNTSHVSFDFDQIHSPNDEIIPSMTNAIREELTQPSSRYNLRPNRGKPGRWANAYITQHEPLNKSIARLGTRATDAIKAELSQMVSKQVWEPMPFAEMRHRKCISSKMFIKEKSDGRVKARLVAGGHQQDRGIYEDLSSPTVDTTSVFAMAAVAAEEERFVISIDFEAAYLNAERTHSRDRSIYETQ
jgi:hypothetical protein